MTYEQFLILKYNDQSVLHKCETWAVTFACGHRMACGKQISYRAGEGQKKLKDADKNLIALTPEFDYTVGGAELLAGKHYDKLCPECFPNGLEEQD